MGRVRVENVRLCVVAFQRYCDRFFRRKMIALSYKGSSSCNYTSFSRILFGVGVTFSNFSSSQCPAVQRFCSSLSSLLLYYFVGFSLRKSSRVVFVMDFP
uniref:Uncharacterized protein n=1 Tax=Cacopsylla melanoneura TaxID=428564 RepID=A0A8D8ZAW7_9HEMI